MVDEPCEAAPHVQFDGAVKTRTLPLSSWRCLGDSRVVPTTSGAEHHLSTVHELRLAAQTGQCSALVAVFDPAVALLTDSGGNVPADTRAARGPDDVAERMCELLNCEPTDVREHNVNGQPALVLRRHGRVMGIVSVGVRGDLVTDLWLVLNPDKLRHWN